VYTRIVWGVCLAAALSGWTRPAAADTYHVIIKGTVTMEDGTPPPFTVGIERTCSDLQGSAPGPITNKKGEYVWNMEIDAFATRSCWIRATHAGYTSTSLDISNINVTSHDTTHTMEPLVISSTAADPYAIIVSDDNIPFKAKSKFNAAMKALDGPDFPEAAANLEAAVKASPKFGQGWHALGVVKERMKKNDEARDAFEHAIAAEPKLLQPYVTLARLCLKTKDWECASKTADQEIKIDAKRVYPEIYIHQAVARFELKDLAGAESSVQEAIRLDPKHKRAREEYVLGRILEAKGDTGGAKTHISKYLELEPKPADIDLIQNALQSLGKPDAAGAAPDLEVL
jgi:Tfp pilus assembly protein PilF